MDLLTVIFLHRWGNQYVCFRDRSEVVIPYVCLKHVKELDVGMAEPDYEITSDRPLVEVEIAIEQSSGLLVRKHTRVVAILLDLSMLNQWGAICYRENKTLIWCLVCS